MTDFNLDLDRKERLGFPEIIYGEFKTPDQLRRIVDYAQDQGQDVLITRLAADKAGALPGRGNYDPIGQTYTLYPQPPLPMAAGCVALLSAGTSDLPVVREAENTLRFLNCRAQVHGDIGVAGIHRLMDRLDELKRCDVIICVAGFEGALPSVVGGLLPQPLIAVPTSVGYGTAEGGRTALNAMLTSCANGITVVNIDNGCGAAMAARRILRSIHPEPNSE